MPFDQTAYWVRRHRTLPPGDPRSVGNMGHSLEENIRAENMLKASVQRVSSALRRADYQSVLDLGCGYGRLAHSFIQGGLSYTGIDVSQIAIDHAASANPEGRFFVRDLLTWTTSETFDIVFAIYV